MTDNEEYVLLVQLFSNQPDSDQSESKAHRHHAQELDSLKTKLLTLRMTQQRTKAVEKSRSQDFCWVVMAVALPPPSVCVVEN